jgi:hypothetical protein
VSEVRQSRVEVLYHAVEERGRRADGVLRMREVQTHVFAEQLIPFLSSEVLLSLDVQTHVFAEHFILFLSSRARCYERL